ncbi:glycosyltransferase [Peribacillus sp. TH24]|uniref:glycosyltransferase n=1 Tax=Peribacillus sp. TH24 TaxID=2798483 RepID=UPI0019122CE9|nr:glycosyltransferase [Peribacillus sp. TH24]MBK5442702.1 glycosyltransferase [Peribacillus sp. TH24]
MLIPLNLFWKCEKNKETRKTVVYTGTLNKKFGVVNLIKAFHAIDNPNAILKICGRGDSEDLIKEYAKKDDRIHFLGQLSNEEAVKLQKNATVLVNPRQNNEEFTKYSFPSKNMEYLLSGNPVIAYKLDGIPDEYNGYLLYVEENSLESFSSKISEVLNLTIQDRDDIGKRAREFVINNKNNNEASNKIINMIKSN